MSQTSDATDGPNSGGATPIRALKKILDFLKEYKELFAAIAFFAGGVLWILGYFATKEELGALKDNTSKQNQTMSCLLRRHVQLLEGEQESKIARDDLLTVMADLRKQTPNRGTPSEADIRNISRLEQQRDEIKSKLSTAEKSVAEAKGAIMFRECEK
jgi:hypothetical protein